MGELRTPWEADAPATIPTPCAFASRTSPGPRGRRPAAARAGPAPWLYHHLTLSGPPAATADFAAAARGSGVIPWHIDSAVLEEDLFNLAAAGPARRRTLSIEGCRILARQFRESVEARQARAAALVGHSRACPFDLHVLLPIPAAILQHGAAHPLALAWLSAHWGTRDGLRQVTVRPQPRAGRRLPKGHAVLGYGFFTAGDTPHAAIAQMALRWPSLRFTLQARPD